MRTLALTALLFASACGAGGIADTTLLVDLTDEDNTALCEEVEPQTFTCEGDGFSYDLSFGTDCDQPDDASYAADCTATVADGRACRDAQIAAYTEDPCTLDLPPECDYLESCIDAEE